MSYLGSYWEVYEMVVDGVWKTSSCGFRFLFRLAETRKAAPVARDLTWPSTADDGELLQFFSF